MISRQAHLIVLAAMLLPGTTRAQVVRGTVTDSLQRPIPGAAVSLLTPRGDIVARGVSSGNGTFSLTAQAPGTMALYVRRLGFRAHQSDWRILAGDDTVTINATMHLVPNELARVEIKAQRDSVRRMRILGMNLGVIGGRVITSSEIDAALPTSSDPYDLVQRAQPLGFMVDPNPDHHCVYSTRSLLRECLPVIVDGVLVADPLSLPVMVAPHVVDFMVVLSAAEVGVQFGSVGTNGALLIFTRSGTKRRT